jgi:Tol biopolymer transport system component
MSQKQTKKWFLLFAFILVTFSSIACSFEMGIVEPTQTLSTKLEVQSIEDTAASVGETQKQGDELPSTPKPELDCQKSPISGLIFSQGDHTGEKLRQVGLCGQLIQLPNQNDAVVSPNGDLALFIKENDIWILDLLNGSHRNLTNTPERIEVNPVWWQGEHNVVVFGSWEQGHDLGPTSGQLSIITAEGSDYSVLEENFSNAYPAPEPYGSRIAYDLGGTAWLYHVDKDQKELFDVSLYGLNIHKGMKIGSPAWSPDGKHLAWWVGGVFSPPIDGSVALAVFDLEARSVEILHPYSPIGTGGWLPAPSWSPDGNWLAAVTISEAHKADLWVIRADGGEEYNLGFASNPVWHPDSQYLVFTNISDERLNLVEVGVWEPEIIDFPQGTKPKSWLATITQTTTDVKPTFGRDVYFATSPKLAQSQFVFPFGTPQIYAIWLYSDMREGLTIRREWYLDEDLWLVREEPWDFSNYGANGFVKDISIYDFDNGLEPGIYQLRLYIDDQEQTLGNSEAVSSTSFVVDEPNFASPVISPDWSMAAEVVPPGTLNIQNLADAQDTRTILTVDEISSLAWYPDGTHIVYSIRDRSNQNPFYGRVGFYDELWIVDLSNGQSYPLIDQMGQKSGKNLHDLYISPDGQFMAAIEGNGWADACYVASNLWVKQLAFRDDRLIEVYSYYILSFDLPAASETGGIYIERIIGWDFPTLLKVALKWTCTQENLDGFYLLDLSTLTAEKIGELE